jgi:hypothetical protein
MVWLLEDDFQSTISGEPKEPLTPETVKSGISGVGKFIAESAMPAGGSMAGAGLGTAAAPFLGPLAPAGPIIGSALGGMLGEAATQAAGIKEPSPGDIATTGIVEAAFPVAGRMISGAGRLAKQGLKAFAPKIPGAGAAIKQPMITRMKSLPGKFAPETPPSQLYGELAEMDEVYIRPTKSRETLIDLSKAQKGKDPSMRDAKVLRDVKAIDQTYPREGKKFSEMQEILKDLNEQIGSAQAKGGERLRVLKQRRSAIVEDLEAAESQYPILKEANRAFKQQSASEELKAMIESGVKTVPSAPAVKGKRSVQDFDAPAVLNKFRQITNPRNPEKYDKLFSEGLGKKNIEEITDALEKINDYGPVTLGWSGGGSLSAQRAVAGAGGALAGTILGGGTGALVGGLMGASAPAIIGEALLRRPARAFLLRSLKEGKGKISNPDQFMAALGAVIQRSPTLFEEE